MNNFRIYFILWIILATHFLPSQLNFLHVFLFNIEYLMNYLVRYDSVTEKWFHNFWFWSCVSALTCRKKRKVFNIVKNYTLNGDYKTTSQIVLLQRNVEFHTLQISTIWNNRDNIKNSPNVTSVLQLMDQGVIKILKSTPNASE